MRRAARAYEVAANVSILDTLRQHGHVLASSCESGTCGTCRSRFIDGEPDHRDLVLFDDKETRLVAREITDPDVVGERNASRPTLDACFRHLCPPSTSFPCSRRDGRRTADSSERSAALGHGLGRAFTLMLPTFAADPRIRMVAASDPRADARERFAAEFGAKVFEDAEALCADPDVRPSTSLRRTSSTSRMSKCAAEHGKHVLVEKPMALSIDDCQI